MKHIMMHEYAFDIAVRMSKDFGFAPILIDEKGLLVILPIHEVLPLAKKADARVRNKVIKLRKRKLK